jgi:arylsulfatase A-like enzyme
LRRHKCETRDSRRTESEGLTNLDNSPNPNLKASGNYIIQEPYWFLFDKGPVKAMHGSPWRYDTHVPIIFAGPTIGLQTDHRLVQPVNVAPTIAAFLGMTPPGSAQGSPLKEVLK